MTRALVRSMGPNRRRRQHGMALLYVGLVILILFGIISLTVDVGRIRVAKGQVQTASDAAAMAAVLSLPDLDLQGSTPFNFNDIDEVAQNLAAANPVTIDNLAVTLSPAADIEYGKWDIATRTFTSLGFGGAGGAPNDPRQGANAVRVTGWRAAARGDALPMTVARVFNHDTHDVVATSIAMINGQPIDGFGIIGLDYVLASGGGNGARIDSYLPANGAYGGSNVRHNGNTASNGSISLNNSDIYGNARPGVGKTISQGPNSVITGWKSPLETPLSFPPPTVPGNAQNLPQNGGTVNAGVYKTTTWPNKSYTFNGVVTIYITGANAGMSLKGNDKVVGSGNNPQNLKLFFTGGGTIEMRGNCQLMADIYAPLAAFHINGTNDFYGAVIAKSIQFGGNAGIHYDESKFFNENKGYHVVLVK